MAAKVNTKFVLILSFVLITLFALVAGTAIFVIKKSGDDYIRLGDTKAAADDWKAAQEYYSKAVYKEQGNVAYLTKWRDALVKWVPPTQTQLEDAYQAKYISCLRQLGVAGRTDVGAWHAYLGTLNRMLVLSPFSRDGYENLVTQAGVAMRYFEGSEANPAAESLRRYAGLSVVRQMRENLVDDRAKEQVAKALEDLQAALKANPADSEASIAIQEWNLVRADWARRAGQNEESKAFFDAAAQTAADYTQVNPNDPIGWVMVMSSKYDSIRKQVVGKTVDEKLAAELNATIDSLRAPFEELFKRLLALPPEQLTATVLDRFQAMEPSATRSGKLEMTQQLAQRALEATPNDFDMMFRVATAYEQQGKYAEAIETFQKVTDLPQLPVSMAAMRLYGRKVEALYQQTADAFRLNDAATDDKTREETLAMAKKFREALSQRMPADAVPLKYLDANFALANGDLMGAQSLLVDYNRSTDNRNPEALWRLAQVATRLGQPGMARAQYEAILERDRDNVTTLKMLANLETQLQNLDKAKELLNRAKSVAPEDQQIKDLLAVVEGLMGDAQAQIKDPTTKALIDSEMLFRQNDNEGGMKILRDAMAAAPNDTRLPQMICRRLLGQGDAAGAEKVIQDALVRLPNDEGLKLILAQLREKDPLQRAILVIEASGKPQVEKLIEYFSLYRRAEKPELVAKTIEELKKVAPEDPRVVEIQFITALEAKDLAAARQLALLAEQRNLDHVSGLTFKSRLLIAEGKNRDAIIALEEASQKGVLNQSSLLLLARLQMQGGRGSDAIKTYTNALALKPDDREVIKERIRAFMTNGQNAEALTAAREAERHGRDDAEFNNLRLYLEGMTGNRQQALAERQKIAASDPQNRENKMALASLLIDLGQYPEARLVIDDLRKSKDDLRVVVVDARWNAEQNKPNDAAKVFQDYIKTLDEKTMTAEPWMVFGQFLVQRGYAGQGLAVLEEARKYQDPKTVEADKIIGDTCAQLNMMERASDAFRRVVDAGADPEGVYKKRLIEALGKALKYEAAEKELATMGPAVDTDPVLLMLKADIQRGKKDFRASRDTLDRTIRLYPSEFMPYIRRAQLLSDQAGSDAEVVADLEAALRVNPQGWQASMLLSSFYAQRDRIPDAVKYARMTLRLRPEMTDFFQSVSRELLRRNNEAAAVDIADDLLRSRSNDAALLTTVGEIFREAQLYGRAIGYFKQALALSKSPSTAVSVVLTALLDTPPRLDDAEAAIRAVQDQVDKDPALMLTRAEVLVRRGKWNEAENDITGALKIIPRDNPNAILAWYLRSRTLFADPTRHMAYLEKLRTQGAMVEWFAFFKAAVNVDRPTPEEKLDGIKQLDSVIQNNKNPAVLTLAYRMRVSTLYNLKRYEEAVEAARQGLEKFPDDWEMNNNYAFISAKYLNKVEDALPYALKATAGASGSADAWDTLGWIQLRLNKIDDAELSLSKALGLAGPNPTRIPVLLHLADIALVRKNKPLSESRVADAEQTMKLFPNVAKEYQGEIDALRKKIEAS